jgi:4-hydroxy-tetrahydrodipicolinate reductase
MLKIAIAGVFGKMGLTLQDTLKLHSHDFKLFFGTGLRDRKDDNLGFIYTTNLETALNTNPVDVLIDLSTPESVYNNTLCALENNTSVIIGTTGLDPQQLDLIHTAALQHNQTVLFAPNFALGSLLMQKFSAEAAKYFANVEIIESHHPFKKDAPSGTAVITAEKMRSSRGEDFNPPVTETLKLDGARGGEIHGIPIHSVRLPGLLAHQTVLFGQAGEVLSVKHDAMSRECYMPGILHALREIKQRPIGLTIGLENWL